MKKEILMLLLSFSPEKIIREHPFWKKILDEGINVEKEKENLNKYLHIKDNWRYDIDILADFYNLLK